MEQKISHIDELILSSLSGHSNPDETAELKEWLDTSPENREHLRAIREIWLASGVIDHAGRFDKNRAAERFLARTGNTTNTRKKKGTYSVIRYLSYTAAAAALLLIVSYMSYRQGGEQVKNRFADIVIEAPMGAKTKMHLPDGTLVWLNASSKITYSQGFGVSDRQVGLTGEAYFEVQTNPDKPFVVKAGNLNIKATGTSFNVKAYPEEDQIITTLVKGSVTIEGKDEQQTPFALKMTPNQSIHFYTKSSVYENEVDEKIIVKDIKQSEKKIIPVTIQQVRTDIYTSWTSDRLIIDNESFGSVAVKLERRYNVKIYFNSAELKKYRFTGTIKHETIEQMFDVFRYSIPLQYKIDKGIVMLTVDEQLKKRYEKAWK